MDKGVTYTYPSVYIKVVHTVDKNTVETINGYYLTGSMYRTIHDRTGQDRTRMYRTGGIRSTPTGVQYKAHTQKGQLVIIRPTCNKFRTDGFL